MTRLLKPKIKDVPYLDDIRTDRRTVQRGSTNDPYDQKGRLYLDAPHRSYLYVQDRELWFQPGDAQAEQVLTGGATRPRVRFTMEGGLAVYLKNQTGAPTVRGTVVSTSTDEPDGFDLTAANAYDPMGIVYDAAVPPGGGCWVVVAGIAECLLDASDSAALGDWARVSADTAGRITASAIPTATDGAHFREVGHVLESAAAGTLVRVMVHFL